MKTRITELFNIQHPIIQGGMHYVGFAELASAVSNAGGLGIITGLTQKTPQDLAKEIARCHQMTDKPFGVNLTFLPTVAAPDYPGYIDAIIDDTDENISAKIKKFNLIGIPFQLILGKKSEGDTFEFREVGKETQNLKIEEIITQIKKAKSN